MTIEMDTRPSGLPARAPLGARCDASGTTFTLFSSLADEVELCLFDAQDDETRLALEQGDGFLWEAHVPSVGAGQRYGYRVHGPWDPAAGARCNPSKLLLDPYARAIAGTVRWHPAVFGHLPDDADRPEPNDSAPYVPRSIVVAPGFDWGDDRPPSALHRRLGVLRGPRQGVHQAPSRRP